MYRVKRGKRYRIGIRVEGGRGIGLGHLVRCMSLAQELRDRGCKPVFLVYRSEAIKRIRAEGFDVIKLYKRDNGGTVSFNTRNELSELLGYIRQRPLDVLIVDMYNVSFKYLRDLREIVKCTVYIDDVNAFAYPVNIIVNGNFAANEMGYQACSNEQSLLLGPKYNLIRKRFRNLKSKSIRRHVSSLMITMGGSDPHHMTPRLIEYLESDDVVPGKINVVVGRDFDNIRELKCLSTKHKNIMLHFDPPQIERIMLESDVAISAGGSTLYELCACGTPTIALIVADNQEFLVNRMHESGYIFSLGWYNYVSRQSFVSLVRSLCLNYSVRQRLSDSGKNLIDGRGPERVADAILGRL